MVRAQDVKTQNYYSLKEQPKYLKLVTLIVRYQK